MKGSVKEEVSDRGKIQTVKRVQHGLGQPYREL